MKRKNMQKLEALINSLTPNEDARQELWVHILSQQRTTLQEHLESIEVTQQLQQNYDHIFDQLMKISPNFEQKINHFSDLEREILLYLILGFSPDKISKYKGISMVRLEQIIESIRVDKIWESNIKAQ